MVVGLHDSRHERMSHHVFVREIHDLDIGNAIEHLHGVRQPRYLATRQIDLREISRNRHSRILAKPREQHFHLDGGRILGLVDDDECIGQGAAAHEGDGRDLDLSRPEPPDDLITGNI